MGGSENQHCMPYMVEYSPGIVFHIYGTVISQQLTPFLQIWVLPPQTVRSGLWTEGWQMAEPVLHVCIAVHSSSGRHRVSDDLKPQPASQHGPWEGSQGAPVSYITHTLATIISHSMMSQLAISNVIADTSIL